MQLRRDGAQHIPAAVTPDELTGLESLVAFLPAQRPGSRLSGISGLPAFLASDGPGGRLVAPFLGPRARPVRALLFNKTDTQNWALAWHQDRTIAVRERVETPGFGPWTVKSGLLHVEPPVEILRRMLTLRIHLDPAGPANAPLLIAPGSHRLGRVPEPEIPAAVARLGTFACLAEHGDAWLYSTLILHASEPAAQPASRRVLQIDYSADELPGALEWLGV